MIQDVFRAEGLPLDLAYVPLIESAFKPNAVSRAKAKGLWQFMRGTALENGLRADWYLDERADPVKATTPEALAALKAEGIRVVMLTGDSRRNADAVAKQLGIDDVHADVLPEDKAHIVRQLKQEGRIVAMAGDGINDAPALAAADIGIAMGTGTDIAIESAAVTLVKGDLAGLARATALSRATMRNIRQNLLFAFLFRTPARIEPSLGQVGGVVGAVAEQGVAVHAVLGLDGQLAVPNHFFGFLLGQVEGHPALTAGVRERLVELEREGAALKARADEITGKDLPAINKQLWDAGIGAIWKD